MRQITAKSGIALGGIFNYFDGKEAVFIAKHPDKSISDIIIIIEVRPSKKFSVRWVLRFGRWSLIGKKYSISFYIVPGGDRCCV
jgi:hypothetical protein